jgi:hypothetical protein
MTRLHGVSTDEGLMKDWDLFKQIRKTHRGTRGFFQCRERCPSQCHRNQLVRQAAALRSSGAMAVTGNLAYGKDPIVIAAIAVEVMTR